MLECVPNVSEGRDLAVLDRLVQACGDSLLDVHRDPDHHRSVFTLAGPHDHDAERAIRRLAEGVATNVDLATHSGVHPRLGALDVVPFVGLTDTARARAVQAAHEFAQWAVETLAVPVFFYADADAAGRSLPDTRRTAFTARLPDLGPAAPHARLGAVAVGARPLMIAVNCVVDTDDLRLARAIARDVRERDGGLPGVRSLAFPLRAPRRIQVSMNLVALERTGLQQACRAVRTAAHAAGVEVVDVELVGLIPRAELLRCDDEFRAWAGLDADQTIEARLAMPAPTRLDP